jgi:hypothetical protein
MPWAGFEPAISADERLQTFKNINPGHVQHSNVDFIAVL